MFNRRILLKNIVGISFIIPFLSKISMLDEPNNIVWYKGKQLPDNSFYYCPYIPITIENCKNP